MRLFANLNEATDKKRTIVINESQIYDLLFEAVSVHDIHDKYYPQIPEETFNEIISADPTYNAENPDKMGKYGKWLLTLFQKNRLKSEDLYKANSYLKLFNKFNKKIKQNDIMKYSSLPQLFDAVEEFTLNPEQAATKSEEVRKIKEGAEKVYEDNKWTVIVPHTEEAACYYGKNTQWCTAAETSTNYFNVYNEKGLLYINILKGSDTKYQFHFETQSFMDARDADIKRPISETIGLTEDLCKFYIGKYQERAYVPLMESWSIEDFTPIKGLQGYYVDEDSGTLLHQWDNNDMRFNIRADLKDISDIGYFAEYSIMGRFIPIYDGDYYFNLYDVNNETMLFGDGDNTAYIEFTSHAPQYVVVHHQGNTKSIFSLTEMRYVVEGIDEADSVSFMGNIQYIRRIKQADYPQDIAILRNIKNGDTRLISLANGKPLNDKVYKRYSWEILGYHGGRGNFLLFHEGKDDYFDTDILMYDGTLIPYEQVARDESIIPQHMRKM